MPAIVHRRGTAEIVNTVKDLVSGVALPDGQWGSAGPNLAKAFQRVELFDSEQLTEAFRYLLVTEQRVCIVVPLDERFEPALQKHKLMMTRVLPVALLISDRVLGNRVAALWGDNDTPGASGLAELTLPAITGLLLPNPAGVVAEPFSSAVMSVKDTERSLPSRVCIGLEFHCRGGYLQSELGTSPIF